MSYLKGGLLFADALTTVSRKYAEEIQTPEYGHGLEGVVRSRAGRLTGILNGVDYSVWDPQHDKLIAARYSAKRSFRQARVQEGPAGHLRAAGRQRQAPHRRASFRASPIRRASICWKRSPTSCWKRKWSSWRWAPASQARAQAARTGATLPCPHGGEDRLRQCAGAQDRGGRRYLSDAIALRALRLESDLQFALRYGARCSRYGRPG